jgi:selenocysteine-specific elongation factor
VEPGEQGYAELRLAKPIVAAWGQRFILRRASPSLTVAGGVILDPGIDPRRRIPDLAGRAGPLDSADEEARLAAYLAERNEIDASPLGAAWKVGVPPARYAALVAQLSAAGILVPIGARDSKRLVHRRRLESLMAAVMKRIRLELQAHQPRRALPRRMLQTACQNLAPPELVEAAFEKLVKEQQLVRVGENIGPADAQVQLSKNQTALRSKLLDQIAQGGLTPPNVKELAQTLGQKPEQLQPLLTLCIEDGLLVEVGAGQYYPPAALERARAICQTKLAHSGEATMSQLREAWGVTRKYSVPLCEWFDARGLTVRAGDLRRPGPALGKPLVE